MEGESWVLFFCFFCGLSATIFLLAYLHPCQFEEVGLLGSRSLKIYSGHRGKEFSRQVKIYHDMILALLG